LPGLLALTALMRKRWMNLLLVLTIVGFFVNAPTRIVFYDRYFFEAAEQRIPEDKLLWSFEYAPFRHGWSMASRQIGDALKSDTSELVEEKSIRKRYTRVIAIWWWMLPAVGISLWVGILITLTLIGLGAWIIRAGILGV